MQEVYQAFVHIHTHKVDPDFSKDWFLYFQGFCRQNFLFQKALFQKNILRENPLNQEVLSLVSMDSPDLLGAYGQSTSSCHPSNDDRAPETIKATETTQKQKKALSSIEGTLEGFLEGLDRQSWISLAQEMFGIPLPLAQREVDDFIQYHRLIQSTYPDWQKAFIQWCLDSYGIKNYLHKRQLLETNPSSFSKESLSQKTREQGHHKDKGEKEAEEAIDMKRCPDLLRALEALGMGGSSIEFIFKSYGDDYIRQGIHYTQRRQEILERNNSQIRDMTGYLMATLKGNYARDIKEPEAKESFREKQERETERRAGVLGQIELSEAPESIKELQRHLLEALGAEHYGLWFGACGFERGDQNLTISGPTAFIKDWIYTHFHQTIKQVSRQVFNKSLEVEYRVLEDLSQIQAA
jgi:hypothetical protein